jgi:hypothetical protein
MLSSLPRAPPTLPPLMLSSSVMLRDGDGFAPTTRRLHLSLVAKGGGYPPLSGARMADEERICWASTCGDGLEDQRSQGNGRVPHLPASMAGLGSTMKEEKGDRGGGFVVLRKRQRWVNGGGRTTAAVVATRRRWRTGMGAVRVKP